MKAKPGKANVLVPTKGEMDVLQVLWQHGPSTVRFVHDTLNEQKEVVQYTSTLKLMQEYTGNNVIPYYGTGLCHQDQHQTCHNSKEQSLPQGVDKHPAEGL